MGKKALLLLCCVVFLAATFALFHAGCQPQTPQPEASPAASPEASPAVSPGASPAVSPGAPQVVAGLMF